jgi:hypothetical protein
MTHLCVLSHPNIYPLKLIFYNKIFLFPDSLKEDFLILGFMNKFGVSETNHVKLFLVKAQKNPEITSCNFF